VKAQKKGNSKWKKKRNAEFQSEYAEKTPIIEGKKKENAESSHSPNLSKSSSSSRYAQFPPKNRG
jgi:hypothetical protein